MLIFLTGLIPFILTAGVLLTRRLFFYHPQPTGGGRSSALVVGLMICTVWVWLNGTGVLWPVYMKLLGMHHWRQPGAELQATVTHSVPMSSRPLVILLGGGTEKSGPDGLLRPEGDSIEKIAVAAETFQLLSTRGRPLLIVSGGNPQRHAMAEADNYAPDLRLLGVPASDMVLENRSSNTYQNAILTKQLLAPEFKNRTSKAAVLITTASHMQRALLYFDHVGIPVYPVSPPPHDARRTVWPTTRNADLSNNALHELIGIAQFYVYTALHIY